MLSFNADERTALESRIYRIGVFFRLATDPAVRLWLGFGSIKPGVNAYDADGTTYLGLGELRNIPAFRQLLNGVAERVEFTLSGVSGEVLAIASGDDAQQVKGRRADVGFMLFAADWSGLGPVHWTVRYIADFLAREQQVVESDQPIVRTVTLSCGTRFTGRRRPSYSYFSDADQQARFPGDLFCSYAGDYAHGYNKQFPVFS